MFSDSDSETDWSVHRTSYIIENIWRKKYTVSERYKVDRVTQPLDTESFVITFFNLNSTQRSQPFSSCHNKMKLEVYIILCFLFQVRKPNHKQDTEDVIFLYRYR